MKKLAALLVSLGLALLGVPALADGLIGGGGGGSIVGGSTPVSGVCSNGQFIYNNSGVVGCSASSATIAFPQTVTGGTSGGIPYFSATTTMSSSAALAANALVIGGGAGVAPSTTTTAAGALTFLGTPSSANLGALLTDETGTGKTLFSDNPTLTTGFILKSAGTTTDNSILAPTTTRAMTITAANDGDPGVLNIRNTLAGSNSFSAINFLDAAAGNYKLNVGFSNAISGVYSSANGVGFIESSSLVGANQTAPDIYIAQTGTTAGSAYDTNIRQEFVSKGAVTIYGYTAGSNRGTVGIQVLANGKVSAGKASPSYALDVQGTVASYDGIMYKNTSASGSAFFSSQNSDGNDLTFYNNSASGPRSVFGLSGAFSDMTANNPVGFGMGTFQAVPFVIGTNNTERMRLLGTGDIQISNGKQLGFSSNTSAADVVLARLAAGIQSLRGSSSTTPAALNIYTYGASPPSAPSASQALIYADTSGAKIRIMALFPSGAAQQIAIEP